MWRVVFWWSTASLVLAALAAQAAPAPRMKPTPNMRPAPAAAPPELVLQSGHSGEIRGFAFSPDGKLLLSSGEDWTLRLWDVRTRTLLRTWPSDGSYSPALTFSPDSREFAVQVGQPSKVIIRDVATGKATRTWELGNQPSGVAWSPDGRILACASLQETVDLCDARTGKLIRSLRIHGHNAQSLDFSRDGQLLFCGGGGNFKSGATAEIFRVATGEAVATVRAAGEIGCGAFSPDGSQLAVGCSGWPSVTDLEVWDTRTWKRKHTLKQHDHSLRAVRFEDNTKLVAADDSGLVSVSDAREGKHLRSFGSSRPWRSAALGPGLAVVDAEGAASILDAKSGQLQGVLPAVTFRGQRIRVTPDGTTLVAVGSRATGQGEVCEAILWDLRTGQWKGAVVWGDAQPQKISISGDSRWAAVLEGTGTIAILDLNARSMVRRIRTKRDGEEIDGIGFAPLGARIWVAGKYVAPRPGVGFRSGPPERGEPLFEVWDRSGERLLDLAPRSGHIGTAIITPLGDRILAVNPEGRLWEYEFAAERNRLTPLVAWRSAAFSPGATLLALDTGEELRLWDLTARRWAGKPFALDAEVRAVSDIGRVVLYDYPSTYSVWDGKTGKRIADLKSDVPITGVTFLPDGKSLAVADSAGNIGVVDAAGSPRGWLRLLPLNEGRQSWLAHTPAGQYVGSTGAESFIRWRRAGALALGSDLAAELRRPEAVQLALAGTTLPEVFAGNERDVPALQAARSAQLARLHRPEPAPRPEPKTPTEKLARALGSWGDEGTYEERARAVIAKVRPLLQEGADPNAATRYRATALMLAARAKDLAFAREVLARKPNLALKDVYGSTALHEAAEAESAEMVQLLLDAGSDLKDPSGKSLLGLSRAEMNRALVRAVTERDRRSPENVLQNEGEATAWVLLHLGADPNTPNDRGESLLNDAFYPWLMRMLLKKGADPNHRSKEGYPPIVQHAMRGQLDLVRILLDHGADPNRGSADGWTALIFAAQNDHDDVVELLLQRKADPNLQSKDGRAALHLATGDNLGIVRLLLVHRANPNLADEQGDTPLSIAVMTTDAEAVKLLLWHNANPRVRNRQNRTLLQLLAERDPQDRFGIRKILEAVLRAKP